MKRPLNRQNPPINLNPKIAGSFNLAKFDNELNVVIIMFCRISFQSIGACFIIDKHDFVFYCDKIHLDNFSFT